MSTTIVDLSFIMNTENGLKKVLAVATFSVKARDAIVEFICETLTEMANLPVKDLDNGVNNLHKALANVPIANDRVRLNATKCIVLHAIRLHFLDRIQCSAPLRAGDINSLSYADIEEMRDCYLESQEPSTITTGLGTVKVPKLTPLKWPDFKSSVSECLGRAIGKRHIPLSYVIRPDLVGDFDDDYENRREQLIACMTLKGSAFKSDNGDVFSLLLQHTENTEGYNIVSNNEKKRDGRKAWNELCLHFEGATYKERVAQEAATTLKNSCYSGPRRNFTFGDYYTLHATAQCKLLRAGKAMSVEQQIDAFIQGIQCATAQSIVVNLSGDVTIRTSFDSYYNAVASKLELSMSLTHKSTQGENRNVNEVKGDSNKKYRRDKDKNKRQKLNKSMAKTTFVPELKVYEKSFWKSLSNSNKDAVRKLYRENGGTPRSDQISQTPSNSNNYAQMANYPAQNYGGNTSRALSQFELQNYSHYAHNPYRVANSVGLPPYPGTVMVPPPPPYPPTHNSGASVGTITAPTGDVGQAFGNFNPHT